MLSPGKQQNLKKSNIAFLSIKCREMKDKFYVAVARELENHGVVNEKLRKKRKGDIGDLGEEEEGGGGGKDEL